MIKILLTALTLVAVALALSALVHPYLGMAWMFYAIYLWGRQ